MSTDLTKLERERAIFSECGKYRYALYRDLKKHPKWHDKPHSESVENGVHRPVWYPRPCLFIMLNPSTANHDKDDPTIRRCLSFAHQLRCDRIYIANIFAYRTPYPKELRAASSGDVIGEENADWIKTLVDVTWRREDNRGYVIAAWGPGGRFMEQDKTVLGWIDTEVARRGETVHCLGHSQDGSPRHPLMMPKEVNLKVYKEYGRVGLAA